MHLKVHWLLLPCSGSLALLASIEQKTRMSVFLKHRKADATAQNNSDLSRFFSGCRLNSGACARRRFTG